MSIVRRISNITAFTTYSTSSPRFVQCTPFFFDNLLCEYTTPQRTYYISFFRRISRQIPLAFVFAVILLYLSSAHLGSVIFFFLRLMDWRTCGGSSLSLLTSSTGNHWRVGGVARCFQQQKVVCVLLVRSMCIGFFFFFVFRLLMGGLGCEQSLPCSGRKWHVSMFMMS